MSYSRSDQIAVRDAYVALLEDPDVRASAEKAAKRSGVGCSRTTAQRWLRDDGVLRSRGEASKDIWEQKHGDKWRRYATYLKMGYTIKEVAERFDVSRSAVHTAGRRADDVQMDHSTRRHRRAWDPSTVTGKKRREKVRKMAEKLHRGKTLAEVSSEHDVSKRHIRCLLKSPLNPFNRVEYDPNGDYDER